MSNQIIASKTYEKEKFTILLELESFDFFSEFDTKWARDENGSITDNYGEKWACNYYSVGQLNKGFDVTVHKAQKEFERDCHAFDVALKITISKNSIDLKSEYIVYSDYNWGDKITTEELLNCLESDYQCDIAHQIEEAIDCLKSLAD